MNFCWNVTDRALKDALGRILVPFFVRVAFRPFSSEAAGGITSDVLLGLSSGSFMVKSGSQAGIIELGGELSSKTEGGPSGSVKSGTTGNKSMTKLRNFQGE
jgi:hypothetical protein